MRSIQLGQNNARRGRHVFQRFQWLLTVAAKLFALAPGWLRQVTWAAADLLPRNLGAGLRYSLLRSAAKSCGKNVFIGPRVQLVSPQELSIGNNVSIHAGCYIDATGGLSIGDDVSIAHHTSILSTNHTWNDASLPIRDNPVARNAVRIESDVWIGCGCRILAGVTIGRRSVVAAGAVVTRSLTGGFVFGGIPARRLKEIGGAR